MYKSPNKPIQPNQLKSPQRLASPTVNRVKQKYQALSHNKNIQITQNGDKDPSNPCPKAQVEDKNASNGKKHSDSSLNVCVRDERRSQRAQRREQQKKYVQNQTKIKSQWNNNHESIKKRTSQRKENQELKNMQKIQKSKDIKRKEDSNRISQQYIVLKQQTKDEQNSSYPRSEIKIIVKQEQKQKQQVSDMSAQNQSIIPGSSDHSQLYRDTQNGQNIIHQQLSNQNEQNLLNQLEQACYQNYIIKSMPNLPSFNSSQVSTYDKLVNFIKQYLSNYQCQLHKYNTFNDNQTKRKFDLICLDCDLLLCDYCVLFGNGQPNTQGQLNGHQQHKVHKLMKLQQLLQKIKTIQKKYHKISCDLTQMNKKYYQTSKEVVDEQVIQSFDQVNFSKDINVNSFIKHQKMHKYAEKQKESIQNLIKRQKNEKKLQIEEKYQNLLTKLVESKIEAYKNIQKKYQNIKQEANNKIKLSKANFRMFQEKLIQMVNFIDQCLARVNNILDVASKKSLEQDNKQRIQKIVKIIFKSQNSMNMSITQTLQRLEFELKKYIEQDRESKQRDQIKIFIQNALKISYNTYIQQNMDTYVTLDTTFNRNFNKLQILNEQSQIQYKTPHKKQQDYNYKSDGFKSMIFQNNQSKIKKEQEPKVGNISIDSEYKQNQFIINFYGPKNSLQRAKSDKNLFKSLELIPHPPQKRKENINMQIKKLYSPKKQMNKQLQRVKSQKKTKQTFMSRPIERKDNNKKLIQQQIGSLSILSKQNENNNNIKNLADVTQKSFLSKSRMIQDTEKQLKKQIKIKNIIDDYCMQFEKDQDQVNNKKMNKLLDLSYLELNNSELQLILSQIYTKLFKIGNNKIALNSAMSSTNIANTPQTKPKLFTFIKLSDNKITTEGFISIASYLTSASNINISNNMLDLGVLDYIIKNKDKFAPLRIINMKGNLITPFTNANKKQAFLHKKIKEKVYVLGKIGILVHI